jgi:N-acetyltransferase
MIIFNRETDYVLENEALLLRPLAITDYENLLPFALNEPTLWKFSLVPADGAERMRNYIETALSQRSLGIEYAFIVFDKRTNEYAGCTRFYDIQLQHNTVQLGYTWYGKDFQGTGLNKNCKLLLLEFAFEKLGITRVEFRADNNNEISKAAMRSIGCVEEGILRNHLITHSGVIRSSIILSILKTEWENGVKEKLIAKIKSKY